MKLIEEMIQEDIKYGLEMLDTAIPEETKIRKEIEEKAKANGITKYQELWRAVYYSKEYADFENIYGYYLKLLECYPIKIAEKKVEKDIIEHYKILQAKVEKKIGKILKVEHLGGYDYEFEGENGTCKVEVVMAGGYNIQRRHTRWIVKNI